MPKTFGKRAGARASLVLLSVFLFLLLVAPVAMAATYGDVNDDGKINVQDVVLVMKHVLELEELTEAQQAVADVNGDGKINVQDVTLIMQHSLGLIDDFPHAALAVSKVTAVNPKQVEVEFNRILNAEEKSKMVPINFHVGLQGSAGTDRLTGQPGDGSAVAVKDDNKTVLLTMENGRNFENGSTTNRVIVKKAVGITADYTKSDLAFIDNSVPTLVSVHTDSPRNLVLTFSEPLDRDIIPTNVTLNDGSIPLNLTNPVYVDASRELRIETFSDLSAGSYTLAITSGTSLQDYSGLKVSPVSKTFTHTPITTPPSVSVKSSTESTVTIEFSRPINKSTLIGNSFVLFRHTYDTTVNQVSGATVDAVRNPSGDNKTFVIDFGTRLLPPGTTTMWMKYVENTADVNMVKDTWGNTIQPATLTVNTVPDTSAPTATVKMVSGSSKIIEIEFSKPVTGAMIPGNYVLRKGTVDVNFTGPTYNSTTGKYRITSVDAMQGVHTLTISNIRDTTPAQNPMGTQTFTIDVPDRIPPEVTEVRANTAAREDATIVYVYYTEPMGSSALDRANYRFVGDAQYAIPTNTTITQVGNTVKIDLPGTTKISDIHGSINELFVGNVKDIAGNSIETFEDHPILASAPFAFTPASVTVLSTSRVSFVVNRHLQAADKAKIKFAGGASADNVSIANHADGTATVTADFATETFNTDIPTADKINILAGAVTDMNGFSNAVVDNVAITVDKAAPVLESADVTTGGSPTRIETITLNYSENLYAASVSDSDYVVTGYSISAVNVNNHQVILTVTGGTGTTTTVTQVGSIQDVASPRNTLGPIPAFTVPF